MKIAEQIDLKTPGYKSYTLQWTILVAFLKNSRVYAICRPNDTEGKEVEVKVEENGK